MVDIMKSEYEFLQSRLDEMDEAKKEITYLGKEANLQGSETFGHDNPILETKREKLQLFSLQQPKFKEIIAQIASCLVVTEEEIQQRKKRESEDAGQISIGLGAVVTLEIEGVGRSNEFLIAGLTQGVKMDFMGKKYSTICSTSPIWQAIVGKKIGDTGMFFQGGKLKKVSILDVK